MAEEEENEYELQAIPVSLFTGGLDFDQERTLATIQEAMHRGAEYTKALADGNKELMHEFEPLHRLLMGISVSAIIPIMKLIEEGENPPAAMCSVIAGIGGMFFFGGIEYAKALGLDGIGVDIHAVEKAINTEAEEGVNWYPEQKPPTQQGLPENGGLDSLLQRFLEENPYDEEE